jgi:orotidine-5'-phosphate decarboxylase
MNFLQKYQEAKHEKRSVLCVGLDPASPYQRKDTKGAIPEKYFTSASEIEGMMNFCLDMIEKTKGSAIAYKLNMQYAIPFSLSDYKRITNATKKARAIAILDIKLGDIGTSNDACFYWAAQAGFDAVTFSPFAGNIEEASRSARARGMALIVLTLMSNPEAGTFMRAPVSKSPVEWDSNMMGGAATPKIKDPMPAYLWIAQEIARCGAEGAVVGATNTQAHELKQIRELAGKGVVFLVPGVGAQGGDAERAIMHGGENLLINVGRDIIYADNPKKAAEEHSRKFNDLIARKSP